MIYCLTLLLIVMVYYIWFILYLSARNSPLLSRCSTIFKILVNGPFWKSSTTVKKKPDLRNVYFVVSICTNLANNANITDVELQFYTCCCFLVLWCDWPVSRCGQCQDSSGFWEFVMFGAETLVNMHSLTQASLTFRIFLFRLLCVYDQRLKRLFLSVSIEKYQIKILSLFSSQERDKSVTAFTCSQYPFHIPFLIGILAINRLRRSM